MFSKIRKLWYFENYYFEYANFENLENDTFENAHFTNSEKMKMWNICDGHCFCKVGNFEKNRNFESSGDLAILRMKMRIMKIWKVLKMRILKIWKVCAFEIL